MLTETSIRDILQSLEWSYDAAPAGEGTLYNPTLIIGLGGTGIRSLRFLKKYLHHNVENRVQLLGIECDNTENEKYPELPRLKEHTELMLMDANAAIGRMTHARQNPTEDASKYLLDYLPNEQGDHKNIHTEINDCIRNKKGAGQRRRAGRVIFESNTNGGCNLIAHINNRNQELRGLQTMQELTQRGYRFTHNVTVYVVTSLAGGTGAGCIISCLALLRSIFDQDGDTITVIGVLPGEKLDRQLMRPSEEMPATRANALALLRELQATKLQDFPDYMFQFGIANNFNPVTAAKSLADGVFVVDHELNDGTAVPDYLDICHSMALFLYSLVGTGMGSVQAAGNINAAARDNAAKDSVPPVLQAFGISCLSYPTDELEIYALRHIVDQWAGHWLGQPQDDGAVQQAIIAAKQSLQLLDAETFRNYFLNALDIPGSAFLDSEEARENAIKEYSDADLISLAESAKEKLKGMVKLYHSTLDAAADRLGKELLAEADKVALGCADGGAAHAQSFLDGLITAAKNLEADLTAAIAQTTSNLAEMGNETIPKKERWLKLLPKNLWKNRSNYIDAVDELLKLLEKSALAPYMQESIQEIVQRLEKHSQNLNHTQQGIATMRENNAAAMRSIEADDRAGYGVVQFALHQKDFPSFVQGINSPFPSRLALDELSQSAIIKSVTAQMYPPYQQAIATMDLPSNVMAEQAQSGKRQTPLTNMVKSLDTAALPRMRFRDNLPQPEQMAPQKFVAGKGFSMSNHPLPSLFTPPAGGVAGVHAISVQNPHQIICMQTFENFGAANWKQYENCVPHYEKDKWWRHILPDALIEKLPQLRK